MEKKRDEYLVSRRNFIKTGATLSSALFFPSFLASCGDASDTKTGNSLTAAKLVPHLNFGHAKEQDLPLNIIFKYNFW